jgi:hypothetical protein
VEFVHYVEGIHNAANAAGEHPNQESKAATHQHE